MRIRARSQVCVVAALALLSGCTAVNPRVATRLNETAALSGELPANPLSGKVITSWIDKTDKQNPAMATLYGNDVAAQYARGNSGHAYPAGSTLSLVAWGQQEDERWFGGNIPAAVRSVEILRVSATGDHRLSYLYQRYESNAGKPLKLASSQDGPAPNERTNYIMMQRAAVMP